MRKTTIDVENITSVENTIELEQENIQPFPNADISRIHNTIPPISEEELTLIFKEL